MIENLGAVGQSDGLAPVIELFRGDMAALHCRGVGAFVVEAQFAADHEDDVVAGGGAEPAPVTYLSRYRTGQARAGSGGGSGGEGGGGDGEGGPERPNRVLILEALYAFADSPHGRPWMAEVETDMAYEAIEFLGDHSWVGTDEQPLGREIGRTAHTTDGFGSYRLLITANHLNHESEALADSLEAAHARPASATLEMGIYRQDTDEGEPGMSNPTALEIVTYFTKGGPTEFALSTTPVGAAVEPGMHRLLVELGLSEFDQWAVDEESLEFPLQREEDVLRRFNVFLRRHLPHLPK